MFYGHRRGLKLLCSGEAREKSLGNKFRRKKKERNLRIEKEKRTAVDFSGKTKVKCLVCGSW